MWGVGSQKGGSSALPDRRVGREDGQGASGIGPDAHYQRACPLVGDPEHVGALTALSGRDRPHDRVGGIAVDRLRSIIERVERLEEERKALGSDIKDIFAEAKSAGFDIPTVKQLLRLRKKEPAEVEEQESLLELYRRALGM